MANLVNTTNLSPVALFAYNRLAHLQETVRFLLANPEASHTSLYVFCDAPRAETDRDQVRQVRDFVRTITGFKELRIFERVSNMGLADSIVDGIRTVLSDFQSVIVLEDDIKTSPHFLRFMNEAICFYERDEDVWHVSGYSYPVARARLDDTYFLNLPMCWGWATWRRAWVHFSRDMSVAREFNSEMISEFDFDHSYPFWWQLEMNMKGKKRTWFVFWYVKLFLGQKLALFPSVSLVQNIGMDSSGTNTGSTDAYETQLSVQPISVQPIARSVQKSDVDAHREYFRRMKMPVRARAALALRRWRRIAFHLMRLFKWL